MRQEIENHQRFSLRKVKAYKKAGLASVFLGTSLLMANLGNVVHADSKDTGSSAGASAVIENEGNVVPAGAVQDQAKANDQAGRAQADQTVTSQKADDAKLVAASQTKNVSQAKQTQVQKNQASDASEQINKVTNDVSAASDAQKAAPAQNAGQASAKQNKANDLAKKAEDTQTLPIKQESTNTLDLTQAGKTNFNVTNKEVKAGGIGVDDGHMPDSGVSHVSGPDVPTKPVSWPSNLPQEADDQYVANIVFNYKYGDENTIDRKGDGQKSAKELGYSVVAGKAGQDYRPSQNFKINVGYHYKYDAGTGSIYYSNFHVNQDADWNNLVNALGKDNIQIYPAAGKTNPMLQDQSVPVVAIIHNIYGPNQGVHEVATSTTSFDRPYPTAEQLSKTNIYQVVPNMGDETTDMVGAILAPGQSFSQVAQVVGSQANLYNEPRTTSVTYYLYERPYRTIYHFLDSAGHEVAEDGDDTPHYATNGNYTSTYNNSRLQKLDGMKNYVLNDLQNGQKVANDAVTITSTWDPSINKFKNTANNLAFSVASQGGHEDAPDYSTDPEDEGGAYNNVYLTVTAKTSELKPDGRGGISGDTTGITDDKKSAIEKAMYETINQKITANVPNSAPQDLSRHITLGRNVTYNYQTGAITAPDWSTVSGQLPAVTVPKATGYVAAPNAIDATNITGNQVDSQGQYTGGAITINYTPSTEAHYKVYSFVDDQNGDQEIPNGRIVITGQVGKAINPADQGLKVPDKYSLANGNAIPTSIAMTMADPMDASQAKPTVIHLVHATKPRTTTKSFTRTIYETAPGSANKQLLKEQTVTFTSTVDVDQVTGTASPDNWQSQGTATWGALGIGGTANYKTLIDGKEGNSIPAVTLDPKTAKDVEVDVTFAPIPAQSVITFADRVNDGTQAKTGTITTKTLNGNEGDSQDFDFGWVPDGYVEDGAAPAKIELGQNYTVYIKDGIVTVTHTDPQKKGSRVPGVNGSTFPSGVDKDDLNKDAQRVVSVKTPDGKTQTITQTVPMHRDATVDPVNSKVTYTDWEPNKPNDEFPAINVGTGKDDIPSVSGYTPDIIDNGKDLGSKGLPAEKPTDPTKSHNINVTYNQNKPDTPAPKPDTPVEGSRGIIFTDPTGNQVGKGTVKGTEGTDVPVKGNDGKVPGLPDGYVPSKDAPATVHIPKPGEDNSPVTVPVEHGKAVVDHNHPKSPSDVIPGTDIHYPAGVSQDDLNGMQERIINVTKPDGSKNSIDQKVPVYRDATVDEVTGKVTYTDWAPVKSGEGFAKVDLPSIKDEYKTYEPAVTENGQNKVLPNDAYPAAAINPKGSSKPAIVDVHYVVTEDNTPDAVQGGRDVVFADPTGKQIGKGTVKGTEGTNAPVKGNDGKIPGLPDGYVPSKDAPTTVYIPKPGEDHSPVTIPVEHGKAVVDHNHPKNPSDVIPGTDIHYPAGVSQDDLTGTQERIINITKPDGSRHSVDQKVPVYRDATVDEVTGEVTYTDWTPAKRGDKFDSIAIPAIKDGHKVYEPAVTVNGKNQVLPDDTYPAASVNPKGDNKPVVVDVQYVVTKDDTPTAVEVGRDVIFTDPTGKQIGKGTIKGTEGTDVPIKGDVGRVPGLPDGYVPSKNAPTTVHIPKPGEDHSPVTIPVEHGKAVVDHNHPKNPSDVIPGTDIHYPKGVARDDLNGVQEHIINITKPDGTTQTVDQKVPVYRDATIDEVTGNVTYDDWAPVKPGDRFGAVSVPEITQNGKHYQGSIDIDGKEAILSDGQYPATNVDPKGDNKPQTINVKYVLTSTDAPDKPTQDTITVSHDYRDGQKDKNGDPYVIQKGEKLPGSDVVSDTTLTAKDLNKVITRTVTVALPDGTTKTMTQKTSAHRDALFDSKTGKFLKFTPWTSETDHFNAIKLDPVKGYTAHVLDPNGKDLGTTIPETKIDPNDANGGNQTLTVKYTKDQAKDANDGNSGYTDGGNSGAPSVPVNTDTSKTNKSNDDHLQEEIDALKRQVNKLSNEVDKLAAHRVGKGGRTPGNAMSKLGHTNKTGYGVNTGTGTSYAYNMNGGASEVAPSGYNGNGVAQAAAIDNAAQNGYGQELPQTGSENETGIIMAGIMSLAMATAAAIGATKRKKEE